MATRALTLDLTTTLVEYGSAGVYGVVQRAAWDRSDMTGWLVTGGGVLLGIFGESFFGRNDLLSKAIKGIGLSSAGVGGWIAGERMFKIGGAAMAAEEAMLQEAYRAQALNAARTPSLAGAAPASHHPGVERLNGIAISRH